MTQEGFIHFIKQKCEGAEPLLIVIRGSQAYGTQIPTSDTDFAGVYIQSQSDIYGTRYKDQINDDKNDTVFYEVKRFLELIASNNPTVLELLNTPEDCILYKHPIFDEILKHREDFITKACAKSFGGYAVQQIQKAKGLNKKQNWEMDKVTRKDVLDFVYVLADGKSIPWKEWNAELRFEEKFIGAVNVPNARDVYALYYDQDAYQCFGENLPEYMKENAKKWRRESGRAMGFGYKGLVKSGHGASLAESNQLRLSSVPKGETPICHVVYNKDGYTMHCKDYNSYQEWLEKRNVQRYVDVKEHGQQIDGKNMMHCRRLLEMAKEIGSGQGIIVRRPNAEYLISIRRGEVDLQQLIDSAEDDIKAIDRIFTESNLPDQVDPKLIHDLLVQIRNNFYAKDI